MDENRDQWNESDMERVAQWLRELEVNTEGIEVILHMRRQVLELQTRVRQLETELAVRREGHARRLTLYREILYEATWRDAEDESEEG